jgi:restriction system protein
MGEPDLCPAAGPTRGGQGCFSGGGHRWVGHCVETNGNGACRSARLRRCSRGTEGRHHAGGAEDQAEFRVSGRYWHSTSEQWPKRYDQELARIWYNKGWSRTSMPIWTYAETGAGNKSKPDRGNGFNPPTACAYCASPLLVLAGSSLPKAVVKGMNETGGALLGCQACGWWSASSWIGRAPYQQQYDAGFAELRQLSGVLKNLDLTDLTVPTDELRSYLVARYGDRFAIHPKKYEDIVAGVFSDFGFRVRITSFSGDEGIDIFVLDGSDNATAGIQVKRHRGKISAEQIRAFVGALQLQGLTTGIYVTTSSYQKGAEHAAVTAGQRLGLGVKLVNADQFYSALQITARAVHWDAEDPSAPYYQCWHDLQAYLSGFDIESERAWVDRADYIWGSSW